MKKQDVLNRVLNSESSIFSKEDVVRLIEGIEGEGRKITTFDIGRAIDKTIEWMENNERDVFCLDSAEFEISYNNHLEVVGVPLDTDNIREALENNFMDFGETEDKDEEEEFVRITDVIVNNEL
jgi:hypothetical protein